MTPGQQERPATSEPAETDASEQAGDVHASDAHVSDAPAGPPATAAPALEAGTADPPAIPQLLAPSAPAVTDDIGVSSDMNIERPPPVGNDVVGAEPGGALLANAERGEAGPAPPAVPPPEGASFDQREALALRVVAQSRELWALRQVMRQWLADAGVAKAVAEDVVLACGEAAANVIEHAYGGTGEGWMDVRMALVRSTLVVSVSDHGRWQAHRSGDGRGRGIRLIGVLMDQVDLHSDDAGTKVTMRKALGTAEP